MNPWNSSPPPASPRYSPFLLNSMPLRNLVFVDAIVSSYPIRPSPRRWLTGKLHNGSLLIEIPDCLKPYPPPSGPLRAQSRRMPPARQAESTICGISFALDRRYFSISDTLLARCSLSSLKRPFCRLQLARGSFVLPLCPP